jgi:MOSC domain-containing protein YiiM
MHNRPVMDMNSDSEAGGRCLAVYISGKSCDSIELDHIGVVGDGHYGKDPQRSVMLTSVIAYDMAGRKGIDLPDGTLEENILIDIDPYDLPIGSRIGIGEAVLEISRYGTICKHLTYIDNRLPKLLKEKRGIFAKVSKPGIVSVGDTVKILL